MDHLRVNRRSEPLRCLTGGMPVKAAAPYTRANAAAGESGCTALASLRRSLRAADEQPALGQLVLASVTIGCICSGIGVARGGTRDEIRSFRERARAAHDYSTDISDNVQRGRKRCCMAWSEAQSTSGSANSGRCIPDCHAIAYMSQFGQPSVRLHKDECRQVPYRPCRLPQSVPRDRQSHLRSGSHSGR
jgi:hypothetical protein